MSHLKKVSAKTGLICFLFLLSLVAACSAKKNVKSNVSSALETASLADTAPKENDGDGPYYDAVGNESLGRVAQALYGSRSMTSRLLEKNPDLKGVKNLISGQKVYFSFDLLSPDPIYLTKGVLDRYPQELAQHLNLDPKKVTTAVLQKGESLQSLSLRLYGSRRFWTEIYLLNYERLHSGYDRIPADTELRVAQRNFLAGAEPEKELEPVSQQEAIAPPVTPQNNAATTPPPPPPPVAASNSVLPQMNLPAEPKAIGEPPKPEGGEAPSSPFSGFRRILYAVLIIVIAALAFFVTRPPKKKKFDMLDITTHDFSPPPRPKLGDKNPRDKTG